MALIVQKYGGTSVGSTERMMNVARRCLATQREDLDPEPDRETPEHQGQEATHDRTGGCNVPDPTGEAGPVQCWRSQSGRNSRDTRG